MYAISFINKHWYWPKIVPRDIIDGNFSDKEVGGLDILETAKEDGRPLYILLFKYHEYMMNIMELYITLDEMVRSNMKHNYKGRDGQYLVKHSPISSHLDFTLGTAIVLTITTMGATLLYH